MQKTSKCIRGNKNTSVHKATIFPTFLDQSGSCSGFAPLRDHLVVVLAPQGYPRWAVLLCPVRRRPCRTAAFKKREPV